MVPDPVAVPDLDPHLVAQNLAAQNLAAQDQRPDPEPVRPPPEAAPDRHHAVEVRSVAELLVQRQHPVHERVLPADPEDPGPQGVKFHSK